MSEENKSSVVSILGGISAIITAVGGIYVAMQGNQPVEVLVQSMPTETPLGSSQSSLEDSPANPPVASTGTPTSIPTESLASPENSPKFNELQAVINDSDGYTNVRSGQGSEHGIVARVVEGEIFYTIPQESDWWPVRTKDDAIGYVHRSRIKFQN